MDKQIIGIVAGILTSTSLIPQAVKSWKDKKASDVSYLFYLISREWSLGLVWHFTPGLADYHNQRVCISNGFTND